MEVDTGAPCGIISDHTLRKIKRQYTLEETARRFVSYIGYHIPCIGRVPVNVRIGNISRKLHVFVISGRFDSLFGREWISAFVHKIVFATLFATPNTIDSINTTTPCLSKEQNSGLNNF